MKRIIITILFSIRSKVGCFLNRCTLRKLQKECLHLHPFVQFSRIMKSKDFFVSPHCLSQLVTWNGQRNYRKPSEEVDTDNMNVQEEPSDHHCIIFHYSLRFSCCIYHVCSKTVIEKFSLIVLIVFSILNKQL